MVPVVCVPISTSPSWYRKWVVNDDFHGVSTSHSQLHQRTCMLWGFLHSVFSNATYVPSSQPMYPLPARLSRPSWISFSSHPWPREMNFTHILTRPPHDFNLLCMCENATHYSQAVLQLLTGYEGNLWFVGPDDTNVDQGWRLKLRSTIVLLYASFVGLFIDRN